jgi:hypothetical protein
MTNYHYHRHVTFPARWPSHPQSSPIGSSVLAAVPQSIPNDIEGVVVARSTPRVADPVLIGRSDSASSMAVSSLAGYAWLEHTTAFAFRSAEGGFTPTLSFRLLTLHPLDC